MTAKVTGNKDSDGLSPVEPYQGRAPVTPRPCTLRLCHLSGASKGCTNHQDDPQCGITALQGQRFFAVSFPSREASVAGIADSGSTSVSRPDTTALRRFQEPSSLLPIFPPCYCTANHPSISFNETFLNNQCLSCVEWTRDMEKVQCSDCFHEASYSPEGAADFHQMTPPPSN